MKNVFFAALVVAGSSFAEINWVVGTSTEQVPPPTRVSIYSDSRFMACWENTQYDAIRTVKATTNWVRTIPGNNTPGNVQPKKFCVFGDVLTDWGVAGFSTLRQARATGRSLQIAVDDAVKDNWFGWKLTEINLY